jgi:hypothetical protein
VRAAARHLGSLSSQSKAERGRDEGGAHNIIYNTQGGNLLFYRVYVYIQYFIYNNTNWKSNNKPYLFN